MVAKLQSNFAGQRRDCRPWQATSLRVACYARGIFRQSCDLDHTHRVFDRPIQHGLVATATVQFNDDLIPQAYRNAGDCPVQSIRPRCLGLGHGRATKKPNPMNTSASAMMKTK